MTRCVFCDEPFWNGLGLGVCPHGNAHTECCVRDVEVRKELHNEALAA